MTQHSPRAAWPAYLLAFISLCAAAECFAYLFLRHVVDINWQPAWTGWTTEHRRIGPWHVTHPQWGTWRHPNATARHEGKCFANPLHSNSAGARDRERSLTGDNRTIVLGDSYAEGWGMEDGARLTNIMEARLGREFLNFGIAGHGPLQYQLVYTGLAANYAHDQVLVLLLAHNDFTDNDLAHWRARPGKPPAKPYYGSDATGAFHPIYPARPADPETTQEPTTSSNPWHLIRRNSWALRAIQYVHDSIRQGQGYAGYHDATDPQLDAVAWSLQEIARHAAPRNVTIALIPGPNDFTRPGTPNLPARLAQRLTATNMQIIDLLPPLTTAAAGDPWRLHLRCDGHWNAQGNQEAAQALIAAGLQ